MAKTLSKTGISNSSTIQAAHITQSIDALTGASDYDITISGSLVVNGPISHGTDGYWSGSLGVKGVYTSQLGTNVVGNFFSQNKPLELRLHPNTWTNKLSRITLPNVNVYTSSNGVNWNSVKSTSYGSNTDININNLFKGDTISGISIPTASGAGSITYYRAEFTASATDNNYYVYLDEVSVDYEAQGCEANLQVYALRSISSSNPNGVNAWYTASNPNVNEYPLNGWPSTYLCKLNSSLPLIYAGAGANTYQILRLDFAIRSTTGGNLFNLLKIRGMGGYPLSDSNYEPYNKGYYYDGNGIVVFPFEVSALSNISSSTLRVTNATTLVGALTASNISASNNISSSTLRVTGNTNLEGTLGVTGATTLVGALTSSNISASNNISSSTLRVVTNTTVGGTLGVTGATTLVGALTASIISASSQLTIPTGTSTNITFTTPPNGTLIYATDINRLYFRSGSTWRSSSIFS